MTAMGVQILSRFLMIISLVFVIYETVSYSSFKLGTILFLQLLLSAGISCGSHRIWPFLFSFLSFFFFFFFLRLVPPIQEWPWMFGPSSPRLRLQTRAATMPSFMWFWGSSPEIYARYEYTTLPSERYYAFLIPLL